MKRLAPLVVSVVVLLSVFSTPAAAAADPAIDTDNGGFAVDIGSDETGMTVAVDYSLFTQFGSGDFAIATAGYANDRRVVGIDIRIERANGTFETTVDSELSLPYV